MKKLKVAFFGTPDFAVPSLDILANHPLVQLAYVVSMPDRKAGRGMELKSPEVIQYAKEKKINTFQAQNINQETDFLSSLKKEGVDAFIVLAFAQFLGDEILKIPQKGCFNIHTSLLPKYRGAAPIQYALLKGDKQTGVSIQKMIKKMDAGDICWSHPVTVGETETGGQLYTRLKYQAALALNDFVYALDKDLLTFEKQDEALVTYAPTLTRDEGHIIFKKFSYQDIHNRVKGLFPWPGTFCFLNGKRLKILEIEESREQLAAGEVNISLGQLHIGCYDKAIRLRTIQLEGKKPCTDIELLNGMRSKITIT